MKDKPWPKLPPGPLIRTGPAIRTPDRPTCAVCGTLVESMSETRDDFMKRVVFTVTCHGKREQVRVDFDDLDRMTAMRFGLAFATQQRRLV